MGDVLASRFITTSFSISGRETWSQGVDTNIVTVSSGGGAVRFKHFDEYQHILGNITAQQHTNIYAEEYNRGLAEFLIISKKLGLLLDNTELVTEASFRGNSKLANQLRQAAKVIMTRKNRTAERDLFYVELGGFDTHSDNYEKLQELFTSLNEARNGYQIKFEGSFF